MITRKLLLLLFLLPFSLFAQRIDSLHISYWYPAPAPFFKQNKIVKMKITEESRNGKKTTRKSTGEYVLFDTTGHIEQTYLLGFDKKTYSKTTYTYDNLGLPVRITHYKDKITPEPAMHRKYDVYNRPYAEYIIEYGDTNFLHRWQYDSQSRLAVESGVPMPVVKDVMMGAGWVEYFYDSLGRLEKSIGHTSYKAPGSGDYPDSLISARRKANPAIDGDDIPYITDYVYDSTGVTVHFRSKFAQSVTPVKYRFDQFGRIIWIDCPVSAISVVHQQYDFSWGDDGLLQKCKLRTTENGKKITKTYSFEYLKKGEKSKKKSKASADPEQY